LVIARAQQEAVLVIGFLAPRSRDTIVDRLRGFRQTYAEFGTAIQEQRFKIEAIAQRSGPINDG
jgi:hypothetical protein